ncbi:MAG: hypothetical protein JMN24_01685 [gamma proteobacterium endosymbiont of Lamellibrachia anaximandri]|nr:hypothetical protein [gamma proteobacterium endosymbiont of Lamellibrachia anaximandri]MBL3618756.1 hypothetical protein [gamma proteobacterium endosymbiont of Lamellibrachia anaximandri]
MKRRSIDYLIDTAEQISQTNALEARKIAFIPRFMATVSLPASRPEGNEFIRRNGNRTLTMLSSSETGLPFGTMPRLALCAITTLTKQGQGNVVQLGASSTQFLNTMGKSCTGGRNGSLTHAREQLKKLLSCTIQLTQQTPQSWEIESLRISQRASMLWQPTSPGQWQSTLELTSEFFNDVQRHAVPVDLRILYAFSHYPLAMDIYCWLTYRYFSLTKPTTVSWGDLMEQFGNGYSRGSHFKDKFTNALDRVSLLYPQARFTLDSRGIHLLPSPTHIQPRDISHFLSDC